MKKTVSTALEKYLSQVDRHLKYMPVSEKTDILSELKSSFFERMENGQTEEEIIAEMGSPKLLAADYIGESIVNEQSFSFKRFMMVLGFYSLASTAWVAIIPMLAVLAASFFFSCGVSVFAGFMGLLKGVVHTPVIDDMRFVFFSYELIGFPALIVGLVLAVIFFILGVLCWKGTVGMVRFLQTQRWKLKYGGTELS